MSSNESLKYDCNRFKCPQWAKNQVTSDLNENGCNSLWLNVLSVKWGIGLCYKKQARQKGRKSLKSGGSTFFILESRECKFLAEECHGGKSEVSCPARYKERFTSLFQISKPWILDFELRSHESRLQPINLAPCSSTLSHYSKSVPERTKLEHQPYRENVSWVLPEAQVQDKALKAL